MTNEEARAILEEVKTIDDSMYQYNPAYLEALDMAIEALKQPTDGIYITHNAYSDLCLHAAKAGDLERELAKLKPEPCEDAVSREFMYKLGAKCIAARNENGVLVAIASIESLPPVTPKQRTGKWIITSITSFTDRYICSECGHDLITQYKLYDYCPNCGAKMEGESE